METKELKDIIKIWVNARGITNGELDVNGIEYIEGSNLDKLIEFIKSNGLDYDIILKNILDALNSLNDNVSFRLEGIGKIVNQIILKTIENEMLIKNNQLTLEEINKILSDLYSKLSGDIIIIKNKIDKTNKDFNDNIGIVRNDINIVNNSVENTKKEIDKNLSKINEDIQNIDFEANKIVNKIDDGITNINKTVSSQNNNINRTLKQLVDRVEPRVIVKKEIEYRDRYIEVQTTKFVYVDKKENVKPNQTQKIDRGPINPIKENKKDTSWKLFFNNWVYKEGERNYYFKMNNQNDSQMLRLDDFANRYGRGQIGVKLLEMGLISLEKARDIGCISTNSSAPDGANPFKWKWNISSW